MKKRRWRPPRSGRLSDRHVHYGARLSAGKTCTLLLLPCICLARGDRAKLTALTLELRVLTGIVTAMGGGEEKTVLSTDG